MQMSCFVRAVVLAVGLALAWPAIAGLAAPQWQTQQQTQPQVPREDVEEYVERVQESIETLRELTTIPADAIPQYLLERAEAIVVIPSLIRGGFIVGAKHGKGVISVRNRAAGATTTPVQGAASPMASGWSRPAFINMTGGSIGWQIGAESVDLVLLVMNTGAVDNLLEDKFTLGGNVSIAAGPVGRSADAATNVRLDAQILAYSRAKGLFAGATFEGAALHANDSANEAFYGREMSLRDVLYGDTPGISVPQVAATWRTTLASLTAGKSGQ
jgi:lipid-binding SYLF domain-containing protein